MTGGKTRHQHLLKFMEPTDQNIKIRSACPDDAPTLAALLAELGFPASVPVITKRLQGMLDASELVLVAVQDAEVLGLLTVHISPMLHRPTPVGRFTALVVAERARGQGVGSALVRAAERELAMRGCALVEVTSNFRLTGAHLFYEHLGYEATSLRFKKSLSPHD